MSGLGNKEIIAHNINRLMELNKETRIDVCKAINVKYTTFTDWVTAKSYPRIDKIELLAKHFNVSKSALVEEQPTPGIDLQNIPLIRFPIIGTIRAGYDGIAIEEETGEYSYFSQNDIHGDEKDYFVLRIKGNSMYPRLLDGDVVLVHRQSSVDSGDIAAIIYNGNEATVKKVRYQSGEDWLELIPFNPEHETKRIEGNELEECIVLGKVVKLQRDLG